MIIRSFLAIEIPEEIQKKIYESFARLHRQASFVKWVEPPHLHLTLRFLGEVEEDLLSQEISPRVSKVLAAFKPLEFSLGGVGVFPSMQKPRVFCLGMQGDLLELKRLRFKIENELQELPIHVDGKEFQAHIILGRIKEMSDRKIWPKILEEYEKIDFGSLKVSEIILFKSELTRGGPTYTKIRKFNLGEGLGVRS